MRYRVVSLSAALLASCGGPSAAPKPASALKLTSSAFASGQTIPEEFTCSGADISPPLAWSDPPAGTKSFALVVEDPDAPSGTFRHWGVYDISANLRELPTGAGDGTAAEFALAANDFGKAGYGGPCPPPGDQPHHYDFQLLALDIERLPAVPVNAAAILDLAGGHVLARTTLTGRYGR